MENKEYLLSFFVLDNKGEAIDRHPISIEAAAEKDARTKSIVFLKKSYKGNRWEIESITLAE